MEISLKTHSSERTGRSYRLDDLMAEWLPPHKLANSVGGVDMDGTLFENDLGREVFLEKLGEPNFWRAFDSDGFAHLLLPRRYETELLSGADRNIPDLPPEKCRLALDLWRDIVDLHRALRTLIEQSNQNSSIDIQHPLINEFARKMLAFDHVLVELDAYFLKVFNGQLLMRVRFLAGRSNNTVKEMTRRVMERTAESADRFVELGIHPENQSPMLSQRVNEKMLPSLHHDRLIRVIDGTRILLQRVIEHGSHPTVITTNLTEIAEEVIKSRSSPYGFLQQPGKQLVWGTRLETNGKGGQEAQFRSKIGGAPVFGEQKATIAACLSRRAKKPFRIACGDSVRSDGPMGQIAMEHGGVFVAVGKDYETMRRNFHALYEQALAKRVQHPEEKIWYLEIGA